MGGKGLEQQCLRRARGAAASAHPPWQPNTSVSLSGPDPVAPPFKSQCHGGIGCKKSPSHAQLPATPPRTPLCHPRSPTKPSQPAPGICCAIASMLSFAIAVRKNECLCNDWGGKFNVAHIAEVVHRGCLERRLPAVYLLCLPRRLVQAWVQQRGRKTHSAEQDRDGWYFQSVCRKSAAVAALCGVWPVQLGGQYCQFGSKYGVCGPSCLQLECL